MGRTQMPLFDATKDPPAALKAGDLVKFVPSTEKSTETDESSVAVDHVPEHPWIDILKPGPLTTVQDLGRDGYARHGVSRSGVSDEVAMRMCNALLGNDENAAVLEIAMGGFKAQAKSECAVSLAGADCGATLNGKPIRLNEIVWMNQGDELELGFARDGARAYVVSLFERYKSLELKQSNTGTSPFREEWTYRKF